jgi:hypothetical protein
VRSPKNRTDAGHRESTTHIFRIEHRCIFPRTVCGSREYSHEADPSTMGITSADKAYSPDEQVRERPSMRQASRWATGWSRTLAGAAVPA